MNKQVAKQSASKADTAPAAASLSYVAPLQARLGNQTLQRLLRARLLQAKLEVSGHIQRSPDTQTSTEERSQQHIEELARDPGLAHSEWRGSSTAQQNAVVEKMGRRFGEPFAQQFLAAAKAHTGQLEIIYWQPGSGPEPAQLLAHGYRRGGLEFTGNAALEIG